MIALPALPRILRHAPAALFVAATAVVVGERYGAGTGAATGGAFALTWAVLPWWGRVLRRRRVVVRSGGRSGHRGSIPLLGGVPIFVPFAVATAVAALQGDTKMAGLLAGSTLMLAVGLLDDLKGTTPRLKVLAQLLAGSLLLLSGYRLGALDVPGLGTFELGAAEIPLLLFWVVLVTNAINIIDGMDGIAAGVSVVALLGLLHFGVHPFVAAPLAGAVLGFVPHNLPRARIFLGDAGTMFLGFALAALLLEVPARANFPIAVGLIAYALGDVVLALLRRFVRGKPLFRGDRSHIHHKLAVLLDSERLTVVLVWGIAALALAGAIWRPGFRYLVILGLCWALLAVILVGLGQVRLRRMLGHRRPFQELHLLRHYVEGRLRLARNEEEVVRALDRLVTDLPLAAVRLRDLEVLNGGHADTDAREERVKLRRGHATWTWLPNGLDDEAAYLVERRTIVCEVLRQADQRLRQVAAEG